MASQQMINGKAFEYALLCGFFKRLTQYVGRVEVLKNATLQVAKDCYSSLSVVSQQEHDLNASFAVNFLIDLEPKLVHGKEAEDVLQLEILPDVKGEHGDVRDVLAIRSKQKWEVGVSAKNNHRAVKHSRLSAKLDFGKKWLDLPCSSVYFQEIAPLFESLTKIKKDSNKTKLWSELGDYHNQFYMPVLGAFKKEIIRLNESHPDVLATSLITYLIGRHDFYKVIKGDKKVEIQAYNLHGTLNEAAGKHKPVAKIGLLKMPTRLIEICPLADSKTTLLLTFNEGWQMSFRIHNASSRVEPSLKFDINLISTPASLFTNQLFLKNT